MLNFFPTPYPDETLYSILARYNIYSGNLSYKHTINELFGVLTKRASLDFTSGLERLVDNISLIGLSKSEIINNHTSLPYYAAFIPQERVNKIKMDMETGNKSEAFKQMGLSASVVKHPRVLKHCPKCIIDDQQKYGETYWHRIHQLLGVFICPEHQLPLIVLNQQLYDINQHRYLSASSDRLIDSESLSSNIVQENFEVLYEIAKEAQWLLNNNISMPDYNYYKDKYVLILQKINIATVNGSVRQKELIELFKSKYNDGLLSLLNSTVEDGEHNWLSSIVRKNRKVFHPIRHILLIKCLSQSVENFNTSSVNYEPFGNGPWPCLNPTHKLYRKRVIRKVAIKPCSETRKPIGVFECSCGFKYSRRGPDKVDSDQYVRGRIIDFGQIWMEKLLKLSKEDLSIRSIALRLGVDSKTVKHQLHLINRYEEYNERNNKEEIDNKREEWMELINNNLNYSVTQFRQIRPDLYAWLYRNDREWLKSNSSKKIKRKVNNNRIAWNKRDEELLAEVKTIVQNWDKYEVDRLKRKTITGIANKTSKPYLLNKHLHKLHRTEEFISSIVETKEMFRIRRLEWAHNLLVKQGENMNKWSLLREAGIRSEYLSEEVSSKVNEILK